MKLNVTDNFDFVDEFEDKLCQYTGFKYAVCVDCCTNAILISLEAKRLLGDINKDDVLEIPSYTYMSVPMTLLNNGWKIKFINKVWVNLYELGKSGVLDSAVFFKKNMYKFLVNQFITKQNLIYRNSFKPDYKDEKRFARSLICVSFQQKKRLSLGRGGAILFNDGKYLDILKRLRYDGRDNMVNDCVESKEKPDNIIRGYHCYMEPDKAVQGILKLNQSDLLPEFKTVNTLEYYPDLSKLPCFKDVVQ